MKTLEHKLIIYDSNCKVCSSLKDLIVRFTNVSDQKIAAYQDLSDKLKAKVDPDKFKNVMALISTDNAPTIYGAEGVAFVFSSQYRWLDFVFRFKFILVLFEFFYKNIAYNRYIIATPKSFFKCDCYPDRVYAYRISYIFITFLIATALTALFGISLRGYFPSLTNTEAVMQMLFIAGSGWGLQIMLAIALMKKDAIDYIGHLGSIMVVGLLILCPGMIFYFLTGWQLIFIPIGSVLLSSGYMLYLHIHRVSFLGISKWWSFSWFLFLQTTAFYWVYYFHLN